MATPVETPAGAVPETAPAQEPAAPPGDAPDPHGSPGQGLPQPLADGVLVSGRATNDPQPPEPEPVVESDPPEQPDGPEADNRRPEISDLPQWAQDLIKETRGEVARTRVEAKKQAAEEAATAATKKVTEDIGRALGLITDDTPEEEKLTPDQLQELLAGERQSTKLARTELAVFKAASNPDSDLRFNASALLDSRSFLDAVRDIDPSDPEAVQAAIRTAVDNNPWLRMDQAPAFDPYETADPAAGQPGAVPGQPPAQVPRPPAVPSGGSFAGGPGAQPQDLSNMSIDDFRNLRRNTPSS